MVRDTTISSFIPLDPYGGMNMNFIKTISNHQRGILTTPNTKVFSFPDDEIEIKKIPYGSVLLFSAACPHSGGVYSNSYNHRVFFNQLGCDIGNDKISRGSNSDQLFLETHPEYKKSR